MERLIKPGVDLGNLSHPLLSLCVFEDENLIQWPVKVVGQVGYLLVQSIEGVAYDSPPRLARSTSNLA